MCLYILLYVLLILRRNLMFEQDMRSAWNTNICKGHRQWILAMDGDELFQMAYSNCSRYSVSEKGIKFGLHVALAKPRCGVTLTFSTFVFQTLTCHFNLRVFIFFRS